MCGARRGHRFEAHTKGELMSTTTTKKAKVESQAKGVAALDRLEVCLTDAQKAIAALRDDLSTGGQLLVKDVETAVNHADRDLRRTSRAIRRDLDHLGKSLNPKKPARRRSAPKAAAKSS